MNSEILASDPEDSYKAFMDKFLDSLLKTKSAILGYLHIYSENGYMPIGGDTLLNNLKNMAIKLSDKGNSFKNIRKLISDIDTSINNMNNKNNNINTDDLIPIVGDITNIMMPILSNKLIGLLDKIYEDTVAYLEMVKESLNSSEIKAQYIADLNSYKSKLKKAKQNETIKSSYDPYAIGKVNEDLINTILDMLVNANTPIDKIEEFRGIIENALDQAATDTYREKILDEYKKKYISDLMPHEEVAAPQEIAAPQAETAKISELKRKLWECEKRWRDSKHPYKQLFLKLDPVYLSKLYPSSKVSSVKIFPPQISSEDITTDNDGHTIIKDYHIITVIVDHRTPLKIEKPRIRINGTVATIIGGNETWGSWVHHMGGRKRKTRRQTRARSVSKRTRSRARAPTS